MFSDDFEDLAFPLDPPKQYPRDHEIVERPENNHFESVTSLEILLEETTEKTETLWIHLRTQLIEDREKMNDDDYERAEEIIRLCDRVLKAVDSDV